jgi:hypothetical protein
MRYHFTDSESETFVGSKLSQAYIGPKDKKKLMFVRKIVCVMRLFLTQIKTKELTK